MKRILFTAVFVAAAMIPTGCRTRANREAERRREVEDRNSAAYKAGQAAHQIARKAEKAASVAGKKIQESARSAREGWKDQEQKEREQKSR